MYLTRHKNGLPSLVKKILDAPLIMILSSCPQRSHPTSSESSDGAEAAEEKVKKRNKKKHKKHKLRESGSEVCTIMLLAVVYLEMYGILIGTGQ